LNFTEMVDFQPFNRQDKPFGAFCRYLPDPFWDPAGDSADKRLLVF